MFSPVLTQRLMQAKFFGPYLFPVQLDFTSFFVLQEQFGGIFWWKPHSVSITNADTNRKFRPHSPIEPDVMENLMYLPDEPCFANCGTHLKVEFWDITQSHRSWHSYDHLAFAIWIEEVWSAPELYHSGQIRSEGFFYWLNVSKQLVHFESKWKKGASNSNMTRSALLHYL